MKKTIIKVALSLFLLPACHSCSDAFLNPDTTVDIPIDEFFNSESRLTNSLMAAYAPLQWPDWGHGQYCPIPLISDIMGDDVYPGGSNASDNEQWHRAHNFNATPDFTHSGLWTTCNTGVNRANIVIQNIDKVTGVSDVAKNRIYAEALTLRAYYYHWLWKFWGNIPYYTENPVTPYPFEKQYKADEVYAKIIADLDLALDGNKLPKEVNKNELGRITKATAQMLRANVVMYQNDATKYSTVLTDMEDIISSTKYDLYPSFSDLWEDEGEWCIESIFEVNYTDQTSARSWDNPLGSGGAVTPQLIGINAGDTPDYNSGWGFGPVAQKLYDLYEDADQRKDGGILNFAKYKEENPTASYEPRYQNTGYFIKKYLPRKDGNSKSVNTKELNYRNNYRVFRFSETLLIASELLIRTGGDQTKADTYLNRVRARAYNKTVGNSYEKIATLDNLLEEYHLEFACEGHRFWDLVRFGKAEQVLGSRGYTSSKKYLPIPRGEIDKALGTLTQNPY